MEPDGAHDSMLVMLMVAIACAGLAVVLALFGTWVKRKWERLTSRPPRSGRGRDP